MRPSIVITPIKLETRHLTRPLGTAAFGLMLTIAVIGCSGGDDSPATPAPQPEPTTPGESVAADPEPAEVSEIATARPQPSPEAEMGPRTTGQVEGIVFDVGDGSEASFTVEEQLAALPAPYDAVMKTGSVSGEVRLDGGTSSVHIEMTKLTSDQNYRDGYVRDRMFGDHPTATFTVDDVGELPAGFTQGDTVTSSISGTLAMRGSEFPVTFDIEARDDGHSIFVLGSTMFTWEQFGIPVPRSRSVVWLADEVRVQVLLELIPRDGG